MNNKAKRPFMFYLIETIAVYGLTFYGLHFIIIHVFNAPLEVSLAVVVPGLVISIPAVILGLRMAYKRYYTTQINNSYISSQKKGGILKMFFICSLLIPISGVLALIAVVYIYDYNKYLIGICLGFISIALSLVQIPFLKRGMEKLYLYIDIINDSQKTK